MRKFDPKSLVLGIAIGMIGISSFSIAENSPNIQRVEALYLSSTKLYFNQKEVPLTKSLIMVIPEENASQELYIPANDLLAYMNVDVEWHHNESKVNLTMQGHQLSNSIDGDKKDVKPSDIESKAIDLIMKTGNWSYIEPYLDDISKETIEKIVEIYNSKHHNIQEHKKASDYIIE